MSYIGNEPIVSATRTITEVTATAGQTVFVANGGYTVGYIDVFLNGAQLQTVDFTATDGSSITLTESAQVGDVLKLVAWGTFQSANLNGAGIIDGTVTDAKIASVNYSKLIGTVPTWNQNTTGNAATVTDGMYISATQTVTGNKSFNTNNTSINNSNGYLATLEARGTGGAAMMQFHRPSAYAAYFGIDSDNQWKVGGWSAGANSYVVHTDANGGRCYSWVNFNGTGTVAIRASFNVSSITDNGTGNYRVNFTNALPDANYSVVAGAAKQDTNNDGNIKAQVNGFNNGASNANSTAGTTVMVGPSTLASTTDSGVVTVAVFR